MILVIVALLPVVVSLALFFSTVRGPLEEKVTDYFSPDFVEKARDFRTTGRLISTASFVAKALFLLFFAVWLSVRLEKFSTGIWSGYIPAALFFTLIAVVFYFAISLPFSLASYYHGKSGGMITMSIGTWVVRYLKSAALFAIVTAPALTALAWAVGKWPTYWFLPAWAVFSAVSVLLVFIAPNVIDPIFNKFEPLPDGPIRTGVTELAGKAGLEVGEVLVSDASRYSRYKNAYFTGLGSSKRIVLYDNLVVPEKNTTGEVLSIVAHEMGHWKRGHILKGMGILLVGSLVGFFLLAKIYPVLFPAIETGRLEGLAGIVLIVFAVNFLAQPLHNAVSRRFERQADAYSMELTGDAESFIEAEKKLATDNLGDPYPPAAAKWFYGTHPSILERIIAAESYDARKSD